MNQKFGKSKRNSKNWSRNAPKRPKIWTEKHFSAIANTTDNSMDTGRKIIETDSSKALLIFGDKSSSKIAGECDHCGNPNENYQDTLAVSNTSSMIYLEKRNNLLENNLVCLREDWDILERQCKEEQNKTTNLMRNIIKIDGEKHATKKELKKKIEENTDLKMKLDEYQKVIECNKKEVAIQLKRFQEIQQIYQEEKQKKDDLQKILEDKRAEKASEIQKLEDEIALLHSENKSHLMLQQKARELFERNPQHLAPHEKQEYLETEPNASKKEIKEIKPKVMRERWIVPKIKQSQ